MGWRAKAPCQHDVGMAFFRDLFSLHKYAYCLSGKPGGRQWKIIFWSILTKL